MGIANHLEQSGAYISGDQKMIDLLTKPDQHFAKVRPEKMVDEGCVCRLSYPDYIEGDYQQYVMTYTVNGNIKATFTEEDLLRDDQQQLVHTKQDLHWSLVEMLHHKPRETMAAKAQRGMGKVANFSCLAPDTQVLTDAGMVRLKDLTLSHKLWDGVEWVEHDGVVYQGIRDVYDYGGLVSTLDHLGVGYVPGESWEDPESGKIPMYVIDRQGGMISITELDGQPLQIGEQYENLALHQLAQPVGRMKVYDILNAGPRHRFTAGGYLVSNCAYGASGATLDRKIEADTGVTPEPGTGDRLLEVLIDRQPRAFEFMEEMERIPKEEGYIIAQSGRIRHFHLHDASTVGYYTYKGQASALGRESRNFLMQESISATSARASSWLLRFKFKFGLEGRPMAVLYDSVVTLCPNHERHVWKAAHDLFMWLVNGWQCVEGRVLRYPVDHELNQSWSFAPTPDQQKLIDSSPVSDQPNVLAAAAWVEHYTELVRDDEQLSVRGADWMFAESEHKQKEEHE